MTTNVAHPYSGGRPCLPVLVGINQARLFGLANANRTAPQPVACTLLIDTGAEDTYVDRDTMAALGLLPVNTVLVQTGAAGTAPLSFDQFEISLEIRATVPGQTAFRIPSIPVICGDFRSQGIHGLLGRDVLVCCEACFQDRSQSFTLTF